MVCTMGQLPGSDWLVTVYTVFSGAQQATRIKLFRHSGKREVLVRNPVINLWIPGHGPA